MNDMSSSPSLMHQHLLIRPARHDDAAAALNRLAALDSRRTPAARARARLLRQP
jgi:hypothetical protein